MIKSFFISLPLVAILDFVWLGFVMKDFNLRQLSDIGRIDNGRFQVLLLPAIIAYILMALSMTLFSIPKGVSAEAGWEVFLWGALLGAVVYGIYDMTNLAILKNYPISFAVADMAWGIFLYGLVTWIVGWRLRA